MSINDKIKQVLTIKQLSPSQLADEIGVQRSSISHILSGRNRPSLDIIQKIVRCYSDFSYEWFLEDDSQLSTNIGASIDTQPVNFIPSSPTNALLPSSVERTRPQPINRASIDKTIVPEKNELSVTGKQIDRILIFYNDGTFLEYKPA